MSRHTFELDKKAFREEVLQAQWMLAHMEKVAKEKAGSNTHVKPFIGFDRAQAIIYPNTKEHPS